MAARTPFNTKSPTIKRILREAAELNTSPSPDFTATPASDTNIFEWHFTLRGPPSSAFSNGIYHGRIVLPPTYPLRPPSFRFLTPSGRFEPNREICLSISGHHEETWQPAWGIRTALVALRSFMETDARGQLGGLETNEQTRKRLADDSRRWKCSGCGRSNEDILKEVQESAEKEGKREEEKVPEELKMGWKDEMGVEKKDMENTELAQGFVKTADVMGESQLAANSLSTSISPPLNFPIARPAQTVPQPTATTTIRPTPQIAPVQRRSNDGVPMWIDRSIAGVIVCLLLMGLKMLLGY
ncbi:hypothetical protein B7494_g7325 [Chlorociboria aeruginascens]|nr:hypothetical protein B7494_g7325 [Chlorociboria aeruginascens]